MMIKNLGSQVEKVWEGLRPMTKKMIVGAMQANLNAPKQKFSYDAHADWELSRLLTVLDKETSVKETKKDTEKFGEIKQLAETCAKVLEAQTESAEVFILLAERALKKNDFRKIDALADTLSERFSAGEMCEIARQATNPAVRALAYEALALVPLPPLMQLIDDPLYGEIIRNVLELKAFEYESDEARQILDQLEFEDEIGEV